MGGGGGVREITADHAKQWYAGSKPSVIIVHAMGCGACTGLKQTLANMSTVLADEQVGLLATSELSKLDNMLGNIQAVPSLFKVANGKIVSKEMGNMSESAFLEFVKK